MAWIAGNFIARHHLSSIHFHSLSKLLPRKSRPQASSSCCEDEVGVLCCRASWSVAEKRTGTGRGDSR
ncbi:hypothetical protein JCGZ_10537 [Jatropha curcas]|uniref:Uncharacterized protein n=1 Tax=Jatropha curcas TaxID=180498 RepID=A0A067KLT1_JATCU|nr:hypothetical protein JCGZ_10537 [Jatropha curcas]